MTYLKTTLREVELRFFHAAGGVDVVKARSARWMEATDEKMGAWGADLANPRARVAGKVKSGDEVEIWARRDSAPALSRVFVGVVGIIGRDYRPAKLSDFEVSGLSFEAKLQLRHVTKTVKGARDAGALIHEVMDGNDIGVSLAGVPASFGTSVSEMVFDYVDWHEFLRRVAGAVGAGWHIDADRVLHFYPLGTVDSGISENGSSGVDFDFTEDSETVVNILRGFGGISKVKHAEQPTQAGYSRITGTTSKSVRLLWPREEMPLVEVWLKSVAGSASAAEVRLEADNGGNPSGVPLARYIVNASDIPGAGGYVAAFPSAHIIGPGTYVHIIVQGTTTDGVDVGVDGSGNMTYRAYVGYPVASELSDAASIAAYGRREGRAIRDSDIVNLDDLNLRLQVHLTKFSKPLIVGSFRATSLAYLTAPLGRFVTFNMPDVDPTLNAKALTLKEREHAFTSHRYELIVRVADGEREREVGNLLAGLLRRLEALEASSLRSNTNVLQLLTASDSMTGTDVAAIAAEATGNDSWDNDRWDFMEMG